MKKTFKFFMCAAIVAAGFTACSDEVTPIPGGGDNGNGNTPELTGEPTYATFRFDDGRQQATTRSLDPDNAENVAIEQLRVFIFDGASPTGADVAQVDTTVTSNIVTIYLPTSGNKQIFVVANDIASNLVPKATLTYGTLNAVIDVDTKLQNISKVRRVADGLFMLSNRTDSCNFTLTAGVEEADSQNPTSSNYIEINVRRTIAKLAVTQTQTSFTTVDGEGEVTNPSFRMWNVYKNINSIFTGASGFLIGSALDDTTALQSDYGYRVGTGPTHDAFATVPTNITVRPTAAGQYYYMTENLRTVTNSSDYNYRNTTYAAIRATYAPKTGFHFNTITSFTNVGNKFVIPATTVDATAGQSFWRVDSIPLGYEGLPLKALITSKDMVKQIVYHFKNPGLTSLVSVATAASITDAQIAEFFVEYINGQAWYRMDIGEGTMDAGNASNPYANYKLGVERNAAYWANITGYQTLGEPREGDLVGPNKPIVNGPTYLTVTVNVIPWYEAAGSGII